MSTALSHHHRIPVAAAGAAVLAVVTTGVILGVAHDSAGTKLDTPGGPGSSTGQTFQLKGSGNQSGDWDHAGTTSGGKTQQGIL